MRRPGRAISGGSSASIMPSGASVARGAPPPHPGWRAARNGPADPAPSRIGHDDRLHLRAAAPVRPHELAQEIGLGQDAEQPRAVAIVEQVLQRQMGPTAREIVAAAKRLVGSGD